MAEPVAIVGIGCHFPGGAIGPESFWSLLMNGVDAICEAPPRIGLQRLYDPTPRPGAVNHLLGGYLSDLEAFDARFFQMAPVEAARLDPQQRLALMVSWHALEDAGLPVERIRGSRAGVFFGVSYPDYGQRMFADPVAMDPYVLSGGGLSFVAPRVSYFLDLRGPTINLDTACSSSLTAIHFACRSVRDGEVPVAIAGGVNVFMQPEPFVGLFRGGMMAADGRCKSFDARGDGFSRSEGAGAVVLKTLARAEADGDRIYAVICGSAINCDGRASGLLLTPGQEGQEAVIRQAFDSAGVDPRRVTYVETHGTGTVAGDPVEIGALAAVLGKDRPASERCVLGAVKSNIGHLEPAAGVAGLIKTALVLQRRVVPRNLHFSTPNPAIAWAALPFDVPVAETPLREDGTLLASINSFGLGGQNAHAILQSIAQPARRPSAAAAARTHLVPLTAHTAGALRTLAARLADRLDGPEPPSLEDVAYTGAARRSMLDVRAAIICDSREGLIASLRLLAAGATDPAIVTGEVRRTQPPLAFVFSGHGAPRAHMGRALYESEPIFRAAIDEIDRELTASAGWSLVDEIGRGDETSRLDRLDVAQPYIFALQVGLTELYRSWGIAADATVGHSMGEASAAYAAGVLSMRDALKIVSTRTQLINAFAGPGGMAVIDLPQDVAEEAIEQYGGRLDIGAINGPNATVVSGDVAAIEAIVAEMEARGVFARRIRVSCASHSRHMDPVLPELGRALETLRPRPSSVPFYSTVEGRRVSGEALDPRYWCRNLRQPVRLKHAVEALSADGYAAFLEVGHHPLLATSIAATLEGGAPSLLLTSLKRDEPERGNLLRSAAALWVAGRPIALPAFAPDGGAFAAWPPYPWEPQRYWLEDVISEDRIGRRPAGPHPMLGPAQQTSLAPGVTAWPASLEPSSPLLDEHRVGREPVLPATGYVEMMLAAARERIGAPLAAIAMTGLRIHEATVVAGDRPVTLDVAAAEQSGGLRARVSAPAGSGDWSVRAEASIVRVEVPAPAGPVDLREIRGRCRSRITGEEHVAAMARRGIQYGPTYRGIEEIWRRDGEAIASIVPPAGGQWAAPGFLVHPGLLDVCLQAAIAAMPATEGETATVLPVSIDRLHVCGDPGSVCYSHIELVPAGEDGLPACDVTLLDERAVAVATVTGLRVERLDNASDEVDDDDLHQVTFTELPPLETPTLRGRWVIVGEGGGLASDLGARIRAAGGEPLGESWLVERDPPIAGVITLTALDIDTPERAVECADIIRIVRALDGQPAGDAPIQLVIVTRGACVSGDPAEARVHRPMQAGMLALGDVISHEHPELTVKNVDLDPAGADAAALVEELGASDGEGNVVRRGGGRVAPRFVPFERSREPRRFVAGGRSYALTRRPRGRVAFREVRRPAPGPGEIEIEVRAASADGRSCTGVVRAVGDAAPVAVGDRVIALGARELIARYAIVDRRLVWPAPSALDDAEAAIQPSAWLAAAAALGRIAAGDRIRVIGAGATAEAVAALVARAGARCVGSGAADLLIELEPGTASSEDVADLLPGGRWATLGPAATPDRVSGTAPAANRSRAWIDTAPLIDQSPDYVRALVTPIVEALVRGDLARLEARPVAAAAFDAIAVGAPDGTAVEIPGASLPIVRAQTASGRRDAGGTWIVTGGFGGLGRIVAAHLVEARGARGIVLVGRSAADPADVTRLDFVNRLRRAGAVVRIEAVDVADPAAVDALVARVTADTGLPPLSGVLHAAGVLEDGVLARQDRERFERVFAPKLAGAWNLHRATAGVDLEHFVLFSSLTGVFGMPGQSNYAAANVGVDALARERARLGLPSLSIGWGAWSDVGMVSRQQDRIDNLAALGQLALTPARGTAIFDRLLDTDAIVVYAARMDRARIAEAAFAGGHLWALLGNVGEESGRTLDRAAVLRLAGPARLEAITHFVRTEIGQVVRLDWTAVPEDQPLGRIGLDSLMAVAVRSRIVRALGVTVPLVGMLGGSSPVDISRYIDNALASDAAETHDAVPSDEPAPAGGDEAERRAAAQVAARQQRRRERRAGEAV